MSGKRPWHRSDARALTALIHSSSVIGLSEMMYFPSTCSICWTSRHSVGLRFFSQKICASNAGDGVVTFSATGTSSSLKLIDASATTGGVEIYSGATNAGGDGAYVVNVTLTETITYTGLTIKGGSGNDIIENDAKNGIVTDRNGTDTVILGPAARGRLA
jgi:hypothetical protein